ncbi:MAG: SDR family oxidoreductase [Gemmatales bacterium]|nr:SDR family oxidoreductase [Gemmatales bacterium]MCS7161540.1 SDR family oxidoreductase [Gemmatales bacterium]MDW8176743.1 SDR family oxidoreductase [Gemmatales bacterium]MDW8222029.1 SDR family oxidoreductase [Gemmatales bacterium]
MSNLTTGCNKDVMASNQLAGKTAFITGGSSGIGWATARLFAAEGARVFLVGRDRDKLARACAQLGADSCRSHVADVGDPAQVQRAAQAALDWLGHVDFLINNAGTNIPNRAVVELTPEAWDALLRTNLHGAFYCIYALLPSMLKRGSGYIINVSSIAGKRASPLGGAAYSAAKAGLAALATCLAAELQERGIRVATIFPGEVDTPILDLRPRPPTPEQRQRVLRPEDVARAVLFLATLPPHASAPELILKPTTQTYI